MATKKLAKKSKATKTVKSSKNSPTNYLAVIHDVTNCIANDYETLNKALNSIPSKIKQAIASTQVKLKKAKDIQTKIQKSVTEAKKQSLCPK